MSRSDVIWLDGEKQLYANMQRSIEGTGKAAMRGLRSVAMTIIADAKDNLKGNHSVVTGQLRASGKVQPVEGDDQALDVGFFSQDTGGGYAAFVEYGRRSGKMPPVQAIVQWVRKKMRVDEKSAKSIGFLIARRIARKGTTPHPFFGPAIEKNRQKVEEAISNEVRQEIDSHGR